MLKIYNYNSITQEYIGEGVAFDNPRNPKNPIIPANSTTIAPPEAVEGFAICWAGNNWDLREDHRGEVYYNIDAKTQQTVDFIGELPSHLVPLDSPIANPPAEPYYVFDSKSNKWVGDTNLYKQYLNQYMDFYWEQKLNTPYEFEGHTYLPSWRELYVSIWVSLNSGLQDKYTIRDNNGIAFEVDSASFKPILSKLSAVVDEMYTDKHALINYVGKETKFDKIKNKVDTWLTKEYK